MRAIVAARQQFVLLMARARVTLGMTTTSVRASAHQISRVANLAPMRISHGGGRERAGRTGRCAALIAVAAAERRAAVRTLNWLLSSVIASGQ